MRFSSSSKTSHRRLAKMSGRMNSLYLGASFAPRMEQAASQIQDSRDLSGASGMGARVAHRVTVAKAELRAVIDFAFYCVNGFTSFRSTGGKPIAGSSFGR